MDLKRLETQDGPCISLGGALVVGEVADVCRRLLAERESADGALGLDLSGVTDIDTAGVQLLVAATRSREGAPAPFRIFSQSSVLQQALERLGVQRADALGLVEEPSDV